MPSPFAGIDPYLEDHQLWEDVHTDLITEIRAQIQIQVRPRYVARLTPYVTYEDIVIGENIAIKPDVAVFDRASHPSSLPASSVMAAPVTGISMVEALELPSKTQRIEIHDVRTETLVTVIELLSPSNKRPGNDTYESYLRKRRDLLQSDVHFMEIDLLRRGTRWPTRGELPNAPYFVFLSRVGERPRLSIWPLTFREQPSLIPVPLRQPDPDVSVDLHAALTRVYEKGAYDLIIDYRRDPPPPALAPDDAAWLDQRLHEAGLR